MLTIILIVTIFSLGFVVGSYFRGLIFESQDWRLFKWDKTVLGYRPIRIGSMLSRNDKVIMALFFDTDTIPDEGFKYTEDI